MIIRLGELRNCRVSIRLAVLAAVMLAAYCLAVPAVAGLGGIRAMQAAGVAAGLCLAGAAAAMLIANRLRGTHAMLASVWLGMILRLGVPLTAGAIIHFHGGPLAQVGLLWYVVVFYPITLIVGTLLALPPSSEMHKS